MKILEFSDCETFYCPMTGNIIVSQHMSEESDAVEFVLLLNGFDFMTIKTEYEELYELCRVEAEEDGDLLRTTAYERFLNKLSDRENLVIFSITSYGIACGPVYATLDICVNMAYKKGNKH